MYKKISLFILSIFSLIVIPVLNADNTVHRRTLSFAEAARLAITTSAELRQAEAAQTLMEGAWRWGLRSYFPRMSINVSENDRLQQIGSDSFMKNFSLSIDQLLWDGGRTTMARRLERMELDLASSRLGRMAAEVGEAAIAAYRNILSSRAILQIRDSTLSILEEQRRIIGEEVQLGLTLALDLASADINLADARLDIYMLQLELSEMERQFAELLGLDVLPVLIERVDIDRSAVFSAAATTPALSPAVTPAMSLAVSPAVVSHAREQNPDLIEARYSITKRQAELTYASNSWIPTLRLTSNFGLAGQNYPLTRFNWSVGISIEFASPWFQNRFNFQTGWELPNDRTAMVQNSFTPLPDPGSSLGRDQAALALSFERERYTLLHERVGRIAATAVEKCILAEQKRILAIEAAALGAERCRIEETRLSLGHITRTRLMEVLIEQTQREIMVVQAATALLEAERELERLLDLSPGELENFVTALLIETPASVSASGNTVNRGGEI